MKNSFPIKPIVELLNVQQDLKTKTTKLTLFTPLDKKTHEALSQTITYYFTFPKNSKKRDEISQEFIRLHNFNFIDILAIGNSSLETRLANLYIQHIPVIINGIEKKNYKCFVNKNWRTIGQLNAPLHEDGGCSWNCLMDKLHRPEYGIIYTVPIELKSKFFKDDLIDFTYCN